MEVFSLAITIFAYVFVTVAYSYKVSKYLKIPKGLRWELYPVPHEEGYKYGGSYLEQVDWWKKPRHKSLGRSLLHILAKYLFMGSYFEKKRNYWFGLYAWHLGFMLIILFDVLIGIEAILMKLTGLEVAPSAGAFGAILYYATLGIGLTSFTLGAIGSVWLLVQRSLERDMRDYATPQNYVNYVFFLVMFLSGWAAWIIDDATFAGFREFWVGVITLTPVHVELWEWIHIVIFAAFLIYLPLTRSTHYITMILYDFWISWGDTPNSGEGEMEASVKENLNRRPDWSAPHFQAGGTWAELATKIPGDEGESK
jgi:nitrate reductase gamma subunit